MRKLATQISDGDATATLARAAPSNDLAGKFGRVMFENGLLMHTCGHFGNVLRFMAALILSCGYFTN